MRGRSRGRGKSRALHAIALAAALVLTPAARAAPAEVDPDPGRAIFYFACATCHLGQGGLIGQPGPPDLLRDPLPRGDGAEALAHWIASGTGSPTMPAFGGALSAAEIDAVVRFIRAQRTRMGPDTAP